MQVSATKNTIITIIVITITVLSLHRCAVLVASSYQSSSVFTLSIGNEHDRLNRNVIWGGVSKESRVRCGLKGNSYRCGRIGNYYPGGSKTTQGVIIYVVKTMETTGGWKL